MKLETKCYEVKIRHAVSTSIGTGKDTPGVGVEFRSKPTRPQGAYGKWRRFFVADVVPQDIRRNLEELIDKYLESKGTA